MMEVDTTVYQTTVQSLADPSLDEAALQAVVRRIKNAVIGNKSKKALYLEAGIMPHLARILGSSSETGTLIQAAATIGSLAHGYDRAVEQAMHGGHVKVLVRILFSNEIKVVETGCRSLKILYQSAVADRSQLFDNEQDPIGQLIKLLSMGNEQIAEVACTVLARCCDTTEHQDTLAGRGGVAAFVHVLSSSFAACQEAALDGLAAITRNNPARAAEVASSSCVDTMFRMVKDRRPRIRLLVATCIANLNKANALKTRQKEITSQVLLSVVKLLSEPQVREEAPLVMANLIGDSEELQKAACDADSVTKLASFLSTDSTLTPKMRENVLSALAELCALREDSRKMVIQAKLVLPAVVQALEEESCGVREAACRCARSLSRSVKNLRTSLVDAGLAIPLLKLLDDPSPKVQAMASAALCNIVLDFSPMKKVVIEQGGVARLVALSTSLHEDIRLHSVWALKNLMFMAESSVKEGVMSKLTYPKLFEIIRNGEEPRLQEQAVTLLRNLAVGKEKDLDNLFKGADKNVLFDTLTHVLETGAPAVVLQALYVVCNIATGGHDHKDAIISRPHLIELIVRQLSSPTADLRVAAVWCFINLTWQDGHMGAVGERARTLRSLGVEDRLRQMVRDPDLDVRDRVKTAIDQFSRSMM